MTLTIGPTKLRPRTCAIGFRRYANGQTAMLALSDDGALSSLLSINMEGLRSVGPDQIWLRDWGENVGSVAAAVAAGIVTLTGEEFPLNPGGRIAVLAELTPAAVAARDAELGPASDD